MRSISWTKNFKKKVHCLPFNNSTCPSEKILPVGTTTGVPDGGTVIMAPLVLELKLKLVSLADIPNWNLSNVSYESFIYPTF